MTDLTTFLASLRNGALGLPAGDLVEHVTREQLLALLDVVEAATEYHRVKEASDDMADDMLNDVTWRGNEGEATIDLDALPDTEEAWAALCDAISRLTSLASKP